MKEIKNNTRLLSFLVFLFVLFPGLILIKRSSALSTPPPNTNTLTAPVNNNQNNANIVQNGGYDDLDMAMDKTIGQINSYLTSLSLKNVSGPFFEKGAKEVLPFYSNPFTQFDLSLNSDKKGSLKNGGVISLKGVISFGSRSKDETQSFLLDCEKKYGKVNKCLNSEIYDISKFQNLGVFAQVYRKDASKEGALLGDYLVDEFSVASNLNITENQDREFQVSWKIPNDAKPGDYYIAFYLNSNNNFDLWGTPLTVFSYAKTFDFSLTPQDETKQSMGVELDKNNIKINGLPYVYRKPAPTIVPGENREVKIEIPIVNLNTTDQKVNVTYQLFRWGQTDPNNLISSKEESKTFSAGEKSNLSFSFSPDEKESVYNLRITASGENSKSISNVRFVMKDKNKGIFRFLGFAKDQEGSYSPLFCLRNASWEGIAKSKVNITVLDAKGNNKGTWNEDANIGSETRCFVPDNLKFTDNACSKLVGEIFDENDNLIQKEEINYPCEASKNAPSTLDNLISSASSSDNGTGTEKTKVLLILGAILLVLIGIAVVLNNKKNKQ